MLNKSINKYNECIKIIKGNVLYRGNRVCFMNYAIMLSILEIIVIEARICPYTIFLIIFLSIK